MHFFVMKHPVFSYIFENYKLVRFNTPIQNNKIGMLLFLIFVWKKNQIVVRMFPCYCQVINIKLFDNIITAMTMLNYYCIGCSYLFHCQNVSKQGAVGVYFAYYQLLIMIDFILIFWIFYCYSVINRTLSNNVILIMIFYYNCCFINLHDPNYILTLQNCLSDGACCFLYSI